MHVCMQVSELLTGDCLVLATTRPNEAPASAGSGNYASAAAHSKAALYQKVAVMYHHLLKQPSSERVVLEPFTMAQTRALMQVVADVSYPDQYVQAVNEKTGGMPLYIEKVTEFLCQKPWLAESGGEFAANVNKMISNLNFQQVRGRTDGLGTSVALHHACMRGTLAVYVHARSWSYLFTCCSRCQSGCAASSGQPRWLFLRFHVRGHACMVPAV